MLPIDERLRAVALGQTSRLAQYEIEVESPLRPKEIQARIRAGETAEEIADAAGIPVERVRWFEGPVLAERAYIAQQAQTATVRRQGDSSGPGPHLGDIVTERMTASGGDPEEGQWDSRKRGDGSWQVQLTYSAGGRLHIAEWMFDPRRRHVMPEDDTAARLSLPESELPPEPESVPGEATVTPIASRLGAAAGMGGGLSGGLGGGMEAAPPPNRFRPSAPPAPSPSERPVPGDRPVAGRPAAYAQPPAPAPAPPAPAPSYRESATPPSGVPSRPSGAPWSESARRMPEQPSALDRGDYQSGDYQFEPPPAREPEPEPVRAPAPEPAAKAPVVFEEPEPAVEEAPDPVPVAEPEPAPVAESAPEPAAVGEREPAPVSEPAAKAPEPVTEAPAAAGESAPAPVEGAAPAAVDEPAPAEEKPVPAQPAAKTAAAKKSAPAKPEPAAKKAPGAAAGKAADATAKADAAAKSGAAAKDAPAAEEKPRPRPAKKNPRNRRSSVPSWDEIMLGSSRQPD